MITLASVIDVRKIKPMDMRESTDFVYVGRRHPRGWPESKWANPFKQGMTTGQAADVFLFQTGMSLAGLVVPMMTPVGWYARYLQSKPSLLIMLPELAGKRLGCWCGDWSPGDAPIGCHACHLAMMINDLMAAGEEVAGG